MTIENQTPETIIETKVEMQPELESELAAKEEEETKPETESEDKKEENTAEITEEVEEVKPETKSEKVKFDSPEQQEAFNKAYFEKMQAQRDADKARQELEQLKAELAKQKTETKTLKDFEYDEEAYTEYKVEQKVNQMLQSQAIDSKQKAVDQQVSVKNEALISQFNAAADKFSQENPDYNDLVANSAKINLQYSRDLSDAVLMMGPALDHYLLKNPSVVANLNNMSALELGMQLSKLNSTINAPKQVKVSSAPPPAPVVNGGSRATTGPSDTDSMEEFYRKTMEAKKKR